MPPPRGRRLRQLETKRLAVARGGVGQDGQGVGKGVMGFYGGEEEKLIHNTWGRQQCA